jgi:hypothetical protein
MCPFVQSTVSWGHLLAVHQASMSSFHPLCSRL